MIHYGLSLPSFQLLDLNGVKGKVIVGQRGPCLLSFGFLRLMNSLFCRAFPWHPALCFDILSIFLSTDTDPLTHYQINMPGSAGLDRGLKRLSFTEESKSAD